MAVNYFWPSSLPQKPQESFSETGGVLILRTPMDAGPAKMRRRGARTHTLSCSFYMTDAQVEILKTFVETTILGTRRFGFPHPRTASVIEARFVPQDGGQLYSLRYITYSWWNVSLELEVLP